MVVINFVAFTLAFLVTQDLKLWKSALSSVIITVSALAIISLFSAMAAWVLVRKK